MLTDVLKVLRTKAVHEMKLPAIQTVRQPYLLANAETTGPIGGKKYCFSILWNLKSQFI